MGPVDLLEMKWRKVGPAGPTTSTRMDKLQKIWWKLELWVWLEKVKRKQPTIDLIKEYKSIYLIVTGGAVYLIAQSIKGAKL